MSARRQGRFVEQQGFYAGASARLIDTLGFRDVTSAEWAEARERARAQLGTPAQLA